VSLMNRRACIGGAAALAWLAGSGCAVAPGSQEDDSEHASPPPVPDISATPWAHASWHPRALGPWRVLAWPGKRTGGARGERHEGRDALAVQVDSAVLFARQSVRVPPADLGLLRFSWWVPALIPESDMAVRERDDTMARIVLAFDGDRARLSARDAALSELSRALTGEEMPYATLMYVWSKHRPVGTVIHNPRTSRIRKLVVSTGEAQLLRWDEHARDLRADFRLAFGEEPGVMVGQGVMSDTDNTHTRARAWYGPLRWG